MFDWVKNINKPYPEFWKNYLIKLEQKTNRYVAICFEDTNLDIEKPIQIAGIAIINDNIIVQDSFEITLNNSDNETVEIEKFIDFIGNSTLVGHKIYLEIETLNAKLSKLDCGRLKNEILDIEIMHIKFQEINDKNFTIDDLTTFYKLEKNTQHSASDDALSIALLFLKLKAKLGIV